MKTLKHSYPRGEEIPGTWITPEAIVHNPKLQYRCRCRCGNTVFAAPADIARGRVKSCSCYKRALTKARITHGLSKKPEYFAAKNAYSRCTNPSSKYFPSYGGRGIEFHFENAEAMAKWLVKHLPKPKGTFMLDRIDNDGHYSEGNLRWSTGSQSARNKSGLRRITIRGVTKILTEWRELSGVHAMTIHSRIKSGLPEDLWLFKGKITKAMIWERANK